MKIPTFIKASMMIMACASVAVATIPSANGATTPSASSQQRATTTTANRTTTKKTATKPTVKPTQKTENLAVNDTIEPLFSNYKKTSPIGKVIAEYGATEINQRNDVVRLPSRIARVAKGEKTRNIGKVKSILADDMIGYFGLGPKLNTPLKRKAFSSDPNYQWFAEEFEVVKNQLYKHIFFVAIPIESEYDINTESFTVVLPYYQYNSHKRGVYPNTNQLASEIFLEPIDLDISNSRITVKVDENTALKVEGQGCSLVLMGRMSPNLLDWSFKDVTFEKTISFLPVGLYIVRDSDGAIIATLKDAAEGIELLENDGEGDLITAFDMTSVDPNDYDHIYAGRIGNNPIMLCYNMDPLPKSICS